MFDDETLALLPVGFDLHAATKRAVEQSVAQILKDGQTFAFVVSAELNGALHLGAVVRVGDHVELRGDLAGHIGTRQFSGKVDVVFTG